jgi:hypothetical protein
MYRTIKHTREQIIPKNSEVYRQYKDKAIVYYWTSENGKICAVAFKGKSNKPVWHYSFRTELQRNSYSDNWINQSIKNEIENEAKQSRKAEIRKSFVNPYKIGDILHHSWGYEQTNCDFYQVVDIKKASVVLKPIKASTVEGSEGFMCCNLMPVKDAFVDKCSHALTQFGEITPDNPTITKKVSFSIYNDKVTYYISTPYGWCDLWDGKPEYCSWYA